MTGKSYTECGVQTDFPTLASAGVQADLHPTAPYRTISTVDIRGESATLSELILSSPRSRRGSHSGTAQDESVYIDSDPNSFDETEEPLDESVDFRTHTREYQRQSLSYRLPKDRTLKSISARVVSLPETAPTFSAKKVLNKNMRVVSQPEHTRAMLVSSPFSDHLDNPSDALVHSVSDRHHRTRVRVRSNATDLPHTPSPPSSPESIVIIADKSQLPKGFLKNTIDIDDSLSTHADTDGWITWAKSPPRPIPALHGPLSLPYARCPSGAEGTIIEEQDNLPRMIWGLEGDDDNNNRNRVDSSTHVASHPTPRKYTSRSIQPQVPPRFQRMEEVELQQAPTRPTPTAPQSVHQYLPSSDRQQPNVHKPISHADIDLLLPGHGPIDLSTVLRPRTNMTEVYVRRPLELGTDTGNGLLEEPLTYGHEDMTGDWQTVLVGDDGPKHKFLPSSSSAMTELSDFLVPSVSSTSMSSLSSLPSLASHSPVPLESGFNRLSHISQANLVPTASRRMSALEIAQNYRQQQIQQNSLLPTPPNSSSPIWASRFSPYQGSLVSPDLHAMSNTSVMSGKLIVSSNHQSANFRQQIPVHFLSQRSPVIDLNSLKAQLDVSSLAPAAQIQDSLVRTQLYSNRAYNQISLANTAGAHLRTRKNVVHSLTMSTPGLPAESNSPVPPRPPPNTPMAPIHSSSSVHNPNSGRTRGTEVMDVPPSPASPNYRPRSTSQSQARVIPLSQLLSRRLSSVPEEDVATYVDPPRSLSAGYASNIKSRSFSTGQAQKFMPHNVPNVESQVLLVADNGTHASPRTPSPGYERRSSRDGSSDGRSRMYQQHATRVSKGRAPEPLQPLTARGGSIRSQYEVNNDKPGKVVRGGRANRIRGGGNRGRRGHSRSSSSLARNGPERVDSGMTVRS